MSEIFISWSKDRSRQLAEALFNLLQECLQKAGQEEVDAIALGGPIAIAEAKRLVRRVARMPEDEAFAFAEERINALFRSDEAAEGMAAFVAKRKPNWTK